MGILAPFLLPTCQKSSSRLCSFRHSHLARKVLEKWNKNWSVSQGASWHQDEAPKAASTQGGQLAGWLLEPPEPEQEAPLLLDGQHHLPVGSLCYSSFFHTIFKLLRALWDKGRTGAQGIRMLFYPLRWMSWINSAFLLLHTKNTHFYGFFLAPAGQSAACACEKSSPLAGRPPANCTYLMAINTVPCIPAGPKSCLVRNTAWSWCSACSGSERCCE